MLMYLRDLSESALVVTSPGLLADGLDLLSILFGIEKLISRF
jgi:hypothetical protein